MGTLETEKDRREEAEELLRRARTWVCFAAGNYPSQEALSVAMAVEDYAGKYKLDWGD